MLPVESGYDRRTRLLLAGFQRDRSCSFGTGDPLPESLHRTKRTLHPHRFGRQRRRKRHNPPAVGGRRPHRRNRRRTAQYHISVHPRPCCRRTSRRHVYRQRRGWRPGRCFHHGVLPLYVLFGFAGAVRARHPTIQGGSDDGNRHAPHVRPFFRGGSRRVGLPSRCRADQPATDQKRQTERKPSVLLRQTGFLPG